MTAQSVNGIKVLTTEPVDSYLKDKDGNPIPYKRISLALLEDNSTIYVCTDNDDCDFADESMGKVRAHIGWRHPADGVRRTRGDGLFNVSVSALSEVTLGELVSTYSMSQSGGKDKQIEKLVEERNSWRTRALEAERDINAMRRVFRRIDE